MNNENRQDTLLHWRLAGAERTAPPPPSADRMLERLRPWWDVWPDRLVAVRQELANLQVIFGHAAVNTASGGMGVPVPTIFLDERGQTGSVARILFISLRDQTLRVRFQIDVMPEGEAGDLELTLVSDVPSLPLVNAEARAVAPNEYRVETELPLELARPWASLKGGDRMPFSLVLFSKSSGW
jgi:hypothetical protein